VRTASCFFTRTTHRRHTHKRVSLARAQRARTPSKGRCLQALFGHHMLFRAYFSGLTVGRTAHTVSRANAKCGIRSSLFLKRSSMSLLDMGHVSHDLFCIDVRHAWPHTTVPVTDSGASRHASHGRVSHVTSDISVGSDVTSTKPSHHSHTGLTHLTTLHCDKARRPGRGFHTTRLTRPAP
jgi:hypothetical protein